MKIKYKLILSYLILIIFAVGSLGFLIGKKSKDAVFNEATENGKRVTELINTTLSVRNDLLEEKSYGDLNFSNYLINNLVDIKVDYTRSIKIGDFNLPILYAGEKKLSLDDELVDSFRQSTGSASTVFLLNDNKLIRVSTNVLQNNKRAVGTYISSDSIIYKKITNNEEYCGQVPLENETYVSRIKPLLDKNKKVVGAIALGNKVLNDYLEKQIHDIQIGKTGYVYILDSKGNLVVHPNDKGTNAFEYDYVKKIISTKNGTIEYSYKGIKKLAFYKYFEPWDWYIITTANYDDLKSSSKSILYTTLFMGSIIILFGSIVALLITNSLVKPINKLKSYMELAEKGDLSVRSDINSKDEIGILSESFNKMIAENKQLLEKTLQYDRLKTEFISNMSHELRTPLNIIFSTVQIFDLHLNKGEKSDIDKLNSYTSTMKQNCYRLIRLVNNLIDITKIDSGFMELDLKTGNIIEVIEDIVQSTADYVQSLSRTIIFDTDVEEKVAAFDEEKIERILLNLISNAIKFTKPGDTIEVTLSDKKDYLTISIKDTGRGIPQNKLTHIFQRFKQVDPLLSRSHEGSGLGLSIVKSLVEMHEGTIEAKSKHNEGTEFIITLPMKVPPNSDNLDIERKITNETNVEKIHIEFSDIYN